MQSQYKRLTDPQWEIIKEYLPVQRKRKYALRDVVDAIFWTLRVGSQWRNLPESFPKWESVYYYSRKWKADATLEHLNLALNRLERERIGKKKRLQACFLLILSLSKQAPFVKEDKSIDGNKKINGRNLHMITDTLGLVWNVIVHAANKHYGVMAEEVLTPLQGYMHRMKKILADEAYIKRFIDWVDANLLGVELAFSPKPPGPDGFVPVKWRWVSERSFGSLNFFLRLDKDHEKSTESSAAWVLWQNCQIILNRLDLAA